VPTKREILSLSPLKPFASIESAVGDVDLLTCYTSIAYKCSMTCDNRAACKVFRRLRTARPKISVESICQVALLQLITSTKSNLRNNVKNPDAATAHRQTFRLTGASPLPDRSRCAHRRRERIVRFSWTSLQCAGRGA
jgi:hypothetical protein